MLPRALLAIVALAAAILMARFFEAGDYYDSYLGRRHCAAPPEHIQRWSSTNRARRPEDQAGLEQWLEKHPGDVNQLFGAFCPLQRCTVPREGGGGGETSTPVSAQTDSHRSTRPPEVRRRRGQRSAQPAAARGRGHSLMTCHAGDRWRARCPADELTRDGRTSVSDPDPCTPRQSVCYINTICYRYV